MNHLAHLVLAGRHADHRLGALLGDHIKGTAALDRLRPELRHGVRLHRRIDDWSDHHPAVAALRARLEPPWRRYAGVILDILFDHMLDRHWADFCDVPIAQFGAEVDRLLLDHRDQLPPRLERFSRWARATGLWRRFGEPAMLDEIFARVAERHGRREPLAHGTRLLETHGAAIEQAFLALFPDLQARAAGFTRGQSST